MQSVLNWAPSALLWKSRKTVLAGKEGKAIAPLPAFMAQVEALPSGYLIRQPAELKSNAELLTGPHTC
jgi:hypothetical protein